MDLYLVGKLGEERQELRNTYCVTHGGLLVPHPTYFFSDSFRAGNSIAGLLEWKEITRREFREYLERYVEEGVAVVSEILRIVDIDHQGAYLPESRRFLNSKALSGLRESLYAAALPSYKRNARGFVREWDELDGKYQAFYGRLAREQRTPPAEEPRLPGIEELGLRLRDE